MAVGILSYFSSNPESLISFLLYVLQFIQSKKDREIILNAIQEVQKNSVRLNSMIEDLTTEVKKLNKVLNKHLLESVVGEQSKKVKAIVNNREELEISHINGGGIKTCLDEIKDKNKRILKQGVIISDINILQKADYDQILVNGNTIIRTDEKTDLNELDIISKHYSNKELIFRFASTDNHFTEHKNNELRIIEPFEKIWNTKIQSVLINNIQGKLFLQIENSKQPSKKVIQGLPIYKHSKRIVVISSKKEENIETKLFLDQKLIGTYYIYSEKPCENCRAH